MIRTSGFRATLIAVGCAVVAYAVTFLLTNRYTATESLYFTQSADSTQTPFAVKSPTQGDGEVSVFNGALNSPLVGARIQTAIGILESRGCALFLVHEVGLAEHYGVPGYKAVEIARQRLHVDTDKNGFMKVDFDDPSKELAIRVLQAVQDYLGQMSEKLSLNLSQKNRVFVEGQLAHARLELSARRDAFAKTLGKSPTANPELLQKNLLDIRMQLADAIGDASAARAQVRSSERAYRLLLSNATDFPGRVVVLAAINKDLTHLTEELETRRLALVDAGSRFQPTAPELDISRQNQKDVDSVVSQLVQEQQKDVKEQIAPALSDAQAKLASLEATARVFSRMMPTLTGEYSRAAKASANIEAAKRDFTSTQSRVTSLETELQVSKIAEARNPDRFEVVDEPYANGEVAFPKRSLIAFFVFVVVLAGQLVLIRPTAPKTTERS